MSHAKQLGFTLIELLIVVAIIAILAAIAVPNFLEAQVRAKVSRVRADHRSIATALESYRIDHNAYPPYYLPAPPYANWDVVPGGIEFTYSLLTSPVAYMTSVPRAVFLPKEAQNNWSGYYRYIDAKSFDATSEWSPDHFIRVHGRWVDDTGEWMVKSRGPDRNENYYYFSIGVLDYSTDKESLPYDATNGTKSIGDILRWGP